MLIYLCMSIRSIPVTNSFVHELGCDGAVNASADRANNATLWPTDISYAGDFLPYEFFLKIIDVIGS